MKHLLSSVIFLTFIFSHSQEVEQKQNLNHIDQVYQAVMKLEIKELGERFIVVDESYGKCINSSEIENHNFKIKDTIVKWKKHLFPNLKYINGGTTYGFLQNNPKEYAKLRRKYGGNGWFELSTPCFNEDKSLAIIHIKFGRTMKFNNSNFYLLRKTKNGFEIVDTVSTKNNKE